MVLLSEIQSSNALISSTLPPDLVAVFVGATSGIGEITLKELARNVPQLRAYFVGRSQDAGDRITTECKAINPKGKYTFIKANVSLVSVVDEVCNEIKAKEEALNILFLSAGAPHMNGAGNLHLLVALNYYSRARFITNFLPLLQRASVLRRVVTVAAGGLEGPLDPTDIPARHVSLTAIRGHLSTLIDLGLEAIAKTAPEVSFVHNYPGIVNTPLFNHMEGAFGLIMRTSIYLIGRWICVPLKESAERHVYLATSAKYPPAAGGKGCNFSIPLGEGIDVAQGTTGVIGSGVYAVQWDCESASRASQKLLARYRDNGVVERIWQHTESEFKRITGR
ncbi:hypothetical protein F5884DRAFT_892876 [Xylogone sp. PMI_703]|nr:hypothetical protein F5884DRAFT_892876 [Xylogone sp. PMI_703]